jgi:hypothetical protein
VGEQERERDGQECRDVHDREGCVNEHAHGAYHALGMFRSNNCHYPLPTAFSQNWIAVSRFTFGSVEAAINMTSLNRA